MFNPESITVEKRFEKRFGTGIKGSIIHTKKEYLLDFIKQVEAEAKKDALGVVHDEILDTAEFDFEAEKHTTVKWEDVERIIKKYL